LVIYAAKSNGLHTCNHAWGQCPVEFILAQPKDVVCCAAWPVFGIAIAVSFVLAGIDLTGRLYMHYLPCMVCNNSYMGGGKHLYYNAIQTIKNINPPCVGPFYLLDQQLQERRHCFACFKTLKYNLKKQKSIGEC